MKLPFVLSPNFSKTNQTMLASKIAITAAFVCSAIWPSDKPTVPTLFEDSAKLDMLAQVNRLRSEGCQCGRKYMPPVGPLAWNARLEKAALAHATDMQQHNFFAHKGSNGSGIGDRVKKTGYKWYAVGENIAEGYDDFEETLLAWKKSPGHCINLMRGGFTEMGIALVDDIWVQDFGAPIRKDK